MSNIEAIFGVRSAFALASAFLCCIMGACSNSEMPSDPADSASVEIASDTLEGMLRVRAAGASVILGSDESSRLIDRPVSIAEFSYDYSMGRHEVTCGEFNALMKGAAGLELACENGDIPATDITFYDAVLFANARSKAEGLDTAYTYASASFDAGNHCTNLEGFAFHTEIDAYRLPTEAEWVLAARQGWNAEDGWTAENSGYSLHAVCGKVTKDGFCDMAGNAMEWVNDWLGNYNSARYRNLVGASDGGTLGQRVVKGGSYRNAASSIALYTRGDVYTVTSSTRADYVGFRLAFGAIPEPAWIGRDGYAAESRVVPLANSTRIRALTGTYRSKLVFRNDVTGSLSYVDYSTGGQSVVELQDTYGAYHPDISPDGRFVAYCTGLEGVSGKSSVYVRSLGGSGLGPVQLRVESAAIPRWRVLGNGDTVIVYVSDAGNNKDDSAFQLASTWQVKFSNGKFGKPEKLFDGAYHDGISEDGSLAVSGARLLRARVAESGSTVAGSARDTVWYGSEQACNVSLAKDSSKRSLFLDFGGKTGREFVGEDYGTHERLLVIDSTGNLVQSVAAPAGYSFDHSEWARGGDNLAVATLTNAGGAHSKIVLLNLADSSIVELAEGDELWHPALWAMQGIPAAEDALLDPDSAGVYLVPGLDALHQSMRVKMELFWNNHEKIEYILVGSSRVEDGLIPDSIKAGYSLNMGHPWNSMDASFYIAENYAMNHAKNLKAVVFSLDFDLWQNYDNVTRMLIDGVPGYVYDEHHDFWKSGLPDAFVDRVNECLPASEAYRDAYVDSRGFNSKPASSWSDPFVETDSSWTTTNSWLVGWQMKRLRDFLQKAEERGIYVVGVVFPQNPRYRETGSWGRYGPRRSEMPALLDSMRVLQEEYANFVVMNENKMGKHDYADSMAQNTDHLAFPGALQLTRRLDSLLETLK
ncbi:MAG: TIGR02171 family protein [Fibrobacter sp.]|nr:TIGR02171 family protein [Fibrobacter sp.]